MASVLFVIALLTMNDGAVRAAFLDWDQIKASFPAVLRAFRTNISLFVVTELIDPPHERPA